MALGRHSLRGRKICRKQIFCKTFLITDWKMKYLSSTFMMLTCCKLFFCFSNENLYMYWSRNLGGTIYLLALGTLEHKDGPVCMYLCMYVVRTHVRTYACTYVYVCMYVCMYVYVYVYMYVCMNLCMYVCMYVCMYIYIYIYICMYACMLIRMYV